VIVRRLGTLLVLLCFTTSCAVGPDFVRPVVDEPVVYRTPVEPGEAASIANLPWWDVFEDDVLQQLIREALAANYDLKIAVQRVEQARQSAGVARAPFYPQIGYSVSGGTQKGPAADGTSAVTSDYVYGAASLAWEIDVWGRIRRSSEAAKETLLATEQVRRGVLLSLVTIVAQSYLTLLELDRELEIAIATTKTFQETLDLFQRRFDGGVGNQLEVSRARAALAETQAQVPEIERRIVVQENLISVLLGRNPGPIPRGAAFQDRPVPPATPPGLPSELLQRRPDILTAEHEIATANANVGVALANFFPKIGLTALYGGQSTELAEIVTGSFSVWNIAGNAAGPLFQGFALLHQYRGQKAVWEETRARYTQTVITAFSEVSDTLTAEDKLGQSRAAQEVAVRAYEDSVRLSLIRYDSGLASYYEVLESQQLLFPAQISLAQVQLQQLLTVVTLYRALGGGWDLPDEQWSQAP
jgi:multidrug efflux system outer membrane protein